jgi:histidinol phosphatase-like PHP family hydrolase
LYFVSLVHPIQSCKLKSTPDPDDSNLEMAEATRERGYEYIGISDHSQSLKIARGVSIQDLWAQIGLIDRLNGKLRGFRILKSSEVDILADGTLDYPDGLLRNWTIQSARSTHGLHLGGKHRQNAFMLGDRIYVFLHMILNLHCLSFCGVFYSSIG